jgi:hypothetical protein
MGILDEAIREHLELKRQHGADDSELKQLEDDAFGPPQRPGASETAPDAASEAATEFMAQPDLSGVEPAPRETADDSPEGEAQAAPPRREPLADVQEAPERPAEPEDAEEEELEAEGPAEEAQPAAEHEAVPDLPEPEPESEPDSDSEPLSEAPEPAGHTTEERHIIADQPTQMFDVAKEFEEAPEAGAAAPSDEELVEEEVAEPRLGPVEPIGAIDGGDEPQDALDEEDEDDFFDEQRLSDELDQALEAPIEVEEEEPEAEEYEEEPASEEQRQPAAESDEDVLEETPDFLEEAPEDDQLWFEQKPPKDFDFDD